MFIKFQKITSLSRFTKKSIMMLYDSISIVLILFASFNIRIGYWHIPESNIYWIIFGAPLLAIPIFMRFGLYQSIVRYIGFAALWGVGQAVTLYSILWGLILLIMNVDGTPRSIIFINWMLLIIIVGGSRMLARWLLTSNSFKYDDIKNNVVIYGAGSAGRQLSNALKQSGEYNHLSFVDDDPLLQGGYINGVPVKSIDKLSEIIKENEVKEILIALPSISRRHRNKIIEMLSIFAIHVRSLPSVSELAQGKVRIEDLHEVSIKDLLGRDSVKPNQKLLKLKITDKVVLVTGAGGSIGSELCRQIIFLKPNKLILYEISEFFLYQIEQELKTIDLPNVEIFAVLGSIRDQKRFKAILNHYGVQTIYHAAAYKHVPLVEYNNSEGVLNNVMGSWNAAQEAIAAKVETFVLISTDKAVRPTNTMGATKRSAELILQALSSQDHNTCFTIVRFGNVLDSSGSVIPMFKKQIKNGGPVTVTDPEMVRYFMTISEAVELVIQAGSMSNGGDVFVLDMGDPVKIYDLAVRMIQLSGLHVQDEMNPEGDIEIKYIGLRPGEKLFEELLLDNNAKETSHPLIMRAEESKLDWSVLKQLLNQLQEAVKNSDYLKIREILIKIVPEFKPQNDIVDLLIKKN
jgi:FlaA1/EpsC-like NDP-sugar epimerase